MKICYDDETLEERAREYEKLHARRAFPPRSTKVTLHQCAKQRRYG